MFNFFVAKENLQNNCYRIDGGDYNHIKNVLRMSVGDTFLVSCEGQSDLCRILDFEDNAVIAEVIEQNVNNTELPLKLYLFQGLPKGDKMEFIIEKAVELGAYAVVPTEMAHCVVKLDDKKKISKVERWQKLSMSAAKQSKRNIIPEICECMSFKKALEFAKTLDLLLVPYESANGMAATKEALSKIKSGMSVGIMIGPEGGFADNEIEAAKNIGGEIISLGSRILRTETAAVTALSMCMLYSETENKNEKFTRSV